MNAPPPASRPEPAPSEAAAVLFVYSAHENPRTGGPQMMARLIRRLDRRRFRPVLLAQAEDSLVDELRSRDGLETLLLPTRALDVFGRKSLRPGPIAAARTGLLLASYTLRLRALLGSAKPRLVCCMNLRALLTAAPAARLARLPVVWQIGLGAPSRGWQRAINSAALRLATAVFIESEAQSARLFTPGQRRRHARKLLVLQKGIEVERFDPALSRASARRPAAIPSGAYVLGTVGSLIPRKGLEVILEAMARLAGTEPPLHLVAVGAAPGSAPEHHRHLLRRVDELGLSGRVHFPGWQDDVPRWLAGFDAFVLASLGEGISGALREAMCMELPVVAADVGGTPDAVANEVDGLLVPPGDAAALARALARLRADPDLAFRLGRNARETACRLFSADDHAARYQCAFEALLAIDEPGEIAAKLSRRLAAVNQSPARRASAASEAGESAR